MVSGKWTGLVKNSGTFCAPGLLNSNLQRLRTLGFYIASVTNSRVQLLSLFQRFLSRYKWTPHQHLSCPSRRLLFLDPLVTINTVDQEEEERSPSHTGHLERRERLSQASCGHQEIGPWWNTGKRTRGMRRWP